MLRLNLLPIRQLKKRAKARNQILAFILVFVAVLALLGLTGVLLASKITEQLKIPTIGIGAGLNCDGQVLVINDILGLSGQFRPKFVKQYVQLEPIIKKAVSEYVDEVKTKKFPEDEFSFS